MLWQTTRFRIDLTQPQVMGIVNVTPDSFSDGGQHANTAAVLAHCEQLLRDGAHILDIGAESTRPGALPVSVEQELARLLPVLRVATTLGVPISVDTYKPQVMQAALDAGVDILNDIWALRWTDPAHPLAATDVVARHPSCGVCLMHMHREPLTMQAEPMQGDVVEQVLLFLERRAHALSAQGIEKTRIVLDPGIGFGKTVVQNFALLARQQALLALGYPLLVGWSRKSSLAGMGSTANAPLGPDERLVPSVAAALLAVERGARVVRVHDVAATAQALKVWAAAYH